MQSLIDVTTDAQGVQVVNARDLHLFLGSKQDFSTWIKNKIKKYGFIENQDFTTFHNFVERVTLIEYALTLDTAKELAMVEGNAKGKQARQYFIECERSLRQQPAPLSQIDILIQSAQLIKEQEKRTTILEGKVLELEAKTITRPECYTVAGYAALIGTPINLALAKLIGIQAKKICRENNYTVDKTHDPRWGKINVYPLDVIRTAFQIVLKSKNPDVVASGLSNQINN